MRDILLDLILQTHIVFIPEPQSTLFTMATESWFPVANTNINLRGQQFQANKESWTPVLDRFEENLKQVVAEGNDVSLRRHMSRGQLLREFTNCLYKKRG